MNWNLIGTVLSSSILAAFLTKCLDIYSQKINYKRDFYKKIIEERLKVYNKLNDLIAVASVDVVSTKGDHWFIIYNNAKELLDFQDNMMNVANLRLWMSEELGNKVIEFHILINKSIAENNVTYQTPENSVNLIGTNYFGRFKVLKQEVEHLMMIELSTMHKVASFISKGIVMAKTDPAE